ncbi:GLPGLI family protein [Chryseobacterium sp. A321]
MRKILLLGCLFFFVFGFAQNRYKYVLNFKIDSTNRDFVQQEVFNLDILDHKSMFYSESLAKLDSIRTVSSSLYKKNVPEPKLDYIISFDSKENKLFFNETIGFSMVQVEDPRKIKWHITSRTKQIGNYHAQKAYAEFGGRAWTAWFTSDIQVPEGPYKFKGLPGLILRIFDSEEDYSFELFQILKLDKLYDFKSFEKLGIKTIKVDYTKYLELKKKFIESPETALFQMPGYSNLNIPADEMRNLVESLKNRRAKFNNTIELSSTK